jgi:hypothetical protein
MSFHRIQSLPIWKETHDITGQSMTTIYNAMIDAELALPESERAAWVVCPDCEGDEGYLSDDDKTWINCSTCDGEGGTAP